MALVGFPNKIEVTAGSGWMSVLTPDEVVILTKVPGNDMWSEDGTLSCSETNRVILWAIDNATRNVAVIQAFVSSVTLSVGSAGKLTTGSYTFNEVWSGSQFGSWNTLVFSNSAIAYNPDVFSLMREYASEPSAGNPYYAYAQQ